jgi:hypothetical protein
VEMSDKCITISEVISISGSTHGVKREKRDKAAMRRVLVWGGPSG